MKRIIRITEKQLNEIDNEFSYFNDQTLKPYDGQTDISADGKTEDGTDNGNPTLGDKVSHISTPQGYARYRAYGTNFVFPPHGIREGVAVGNPNDKNGDSVDDFYDNATQELDTLGNDIIDDDLAKIPTTILARAKKLVQDIKANNLTAKQQAIVLNKIIEDMDLTKAPYLWKKTLELKIKGQNDSHDSTKI